MKKKINKFLFLILLPVAIFFACAFSVCNVSSVVGAVPNHGGIIYVGNGSVYTMNSGEFSQSSADYGGAVMVVGGSFIFKDGIIHDNSVTYHGGGVYIWKNGQMTMSGGTIRNNNAPAYGGGIEVTDNSSLNFNGGYVKNNSSVDGGGGISIAVNSSMTITDGEISGNTSSKGGGIFIDNTSSLAMTGGSIFDNTATSNGQQIFNAGTFNMSGGTIGTSGKCVSNGIYNAGTMNLYGGTIYDNISTETSISIKPALKFYGTFVLSYDVATIIVDDYAGTTPILNISVPASRGEGTVITFKGSDVEPDLSNINVTGYDTDKYTLKTEKDSSGNWTVVIGKNEFDFPSTWKTEVASSTYMTTTITPANLTSIKFVSEAPSGYTQIGTLSTGLPVYQGTTATDIAFVGKKIYAPNDSSALFSELTNMKTIDFSTLDTSNVTNMFYMFYNCSALTELNLENFNTAKVTNMSWMFQNCSGLTSLNVGSFNTNNVTDMSDMFMGCAKLTTISLLNFNTSKVTTMARMFQNCYKLSSIDLSNFDTSNVTNLSYMFCGAGLTSLNLSSFSTTNVTNMYAMFSGCSGLTSLDVSNFNTSNVTTMGSMFYGCSSLTSLNLDNFNTSKVTSMYSMFYGCSSLTILDLSSFDTSKVTDMYAMFYGCSSLTILNLNSFNTLKVTNMQNTFRNCSSLKGLNLSSFSTTNVTNMRYMFYGCSSLTSLDLSSFSTTNVTDMYAMFSGCSSLASLDVSTFNTSNVTTMGFMFNYCSSLTSLNLSSFITSKVTDMDAMFQTCAKLTSLDLSNFNMTKVTSCSSMLMFGSANKIETLKTPYNNTSVISISTGSTLYNEDTGAVVTTVPAGTTKSLTYVNETPEKELPTDWKTQLNSSTYMTSTRSTVTGIRFESTVPTGYVQIGKLSTGLKVYANGNNIAFINKKTIYAPADSSYLFASNSSLTSISFSNFNTSKVTTMARMFSGDSGLTTIDVTSFDTSNVTSMMYMFNTCTKLETIKIAGIDTSNVTTMASMFAHCTALSSLNLTGFNTAKVTNMSIMFGYLTNLSSLDLSMFNTSNVTSMQQMFYQSTGIKVLNLSSFNMAKVTSSTNMLNFSSSGNLGRIQTPYKNTSAIAITTSGTLYNTSTGSSVTGVSANTSSSQTFAKKVTVTFDAYGGSTPSTSTYTKYYGATFGSSYPSTSRTNYTFQGWYTQVSGGSSIDYYVLVGDTTFYAHWSSNSGGGGSGGTDPEPTPTLPSSFEKRHDGSELEEDVSTLDEQSIFDILDIFNSESSNTFTAEDVTMFAIVSKETLNDYRVEQEIGTVGNLEIVVLSYTGSEYTSYLGGSEWILGIMNTNGTVGFDQWYYFDSMFFVKLSEILPNLETLDLRGLDTSLTTFSFRLPESVENVIINDSNAPLVSTHIVNFVTMTYGTISSTGFGGSVSYGEGAIGGSLDLDTVLSNYITEDQMSLIKGFAIFSTISPEQYADYIFQHEYGQIASGVYLCLVRVTDNFTSKFNEVYTDDVFLAFVSYTSSIYITEDFEPAGGFGDYIASGSITYVDFRGLRVVQTSEIYNLAGDLEVDFTLDYIIVPEDYDNGVVQFMSNATLLNYDGSTRSFISGNNNGSSGNLEIDHGRLYSVKAENVDLYIEDKKWFDPKKNKIQNKTQNDGENE